MNSNPDATVTFPAVPPAGEPTVTFTPVWDDEPGKHAGPEKTLCTCGTAACPDMYPKPVPDTRDALLSYAAGVTIRMSQERVRNGEWEDIAAASRVGALRVHKPAVDHLGRIRLDLEHAGLDLAPMFDRTPALHTDPGLASRLRFAAAETEQQLIRQQTDMHREVLRRIALLRSDLAEREAESPVAA